MAVETPSFRFQFSKNSYSLDSFEQGLRETTAARLVFFGAAGWGHALLLELRKRDIKLPMIFADNDQTKHGLLLDGVEIVSPDSLEPSSDIVVITTVSAGDAVSEQLENLGFERETNYFEVMHSLSPAYVPRIADWYSDLVGGVEGLDILHVGPGGHLGVELLLSAYGAKSVTSVERYAFALQYPKATKSSSSFYRKLSKLTSETLRMDLFELGLLEECEESVIISDEKLLLLFPCSVTALPFADNSFDLVLHHAVFEHVLEPEKGYQEIARVLRPGGKTAGRVDPHDHRAQASIAGFYPLRFLEHSRKEWYEINSTFNPHNQFTTPEHRKAIESTGLTITSWTDEWRYEISDEQWEAFHPSFRELDREEIQIVRFSFVAEKPK